jgi:hypothetical protein
MSFFERLHCDLNVIEESSKLNKIKQISVNMAKSLLLMIAVFGVLLITPFAEGQIFEKATFQEVMTVIYDQKISNSIITSIGFETIDNKEIRFPDELIKKINDNEDIRAVVITNAGNCVIGVTSEEQCIMINFDYQQLKGDGGIRTVQDSAKEISKEIIDDIEQMTGMKTKFHSTFIHTVDDANILLDTSGIISGRGAVSATYTMPKQSTDYLFLDLSGKLIPKEIRDGGGFFDIAKEISKDDESIISVSLVKIEDSNLMMFKVANEIKEESIDISNINILEDVGITEISRSDIFNDRIVPLNSVIQLIIIPNELSKIDAISTHAITDVTKLKEISKKGWFFSSPSGNKIDAKFLFGQEKVIFSDELRIEIGPWDGNNEMSFYSVEDIDSKIDYQSIEDFTEKDLDDNGDLSQYVILIVIIMIGIGAAVFYLKGYKSKR